MKFKEFITDPVSGEGSMSRLCMGILIIIWIPTYFYLRYIKVDVDHRVIIACVASVAGVYGVNSLTGPVTKIINKIRGKEEGSDINVKTTINNAGERGEV